MDASEYSEGIWFMGDWYGLEDIPSIIQHAGLNETNIAEFVLEVIEDVNLRTLFEFEVQCDIELQTVAEPTDPRWSTRIVMSVPLFSWNFLRVILEQVIRRYPEGYKGRP